MSQEYSASVEWLREGIGIIRVHPGEGKGYGDPFILAATIEAEREAVIVRAAVGEMPREAARAMNDLLYSLGFRRRCHNRIGERSPDYGTDKPRRDRKFIGTNPSRMIWHDLLPPRETPA